MNIHTAKLSELLGLKAQGAKWLRVAAYSYGDREKGDLLSWHKSYFTAVHNAHGASFQAILRLADVLEEARYCQTRIQTPGPEAA